MAGVKQLEFLGMKEKAKILETAVNTAVQEKLGSAKSGEFMARVREVIDEQIETYQTEAQSQ